MTSDIATPMFRQYQKIKTQHHDCILFFRLGDFYEMFYEDAQVASKILDLVLTTRGKGTSHAAPMCGIPYHAAENYIARLIKAGKKVAICEQVEDPCQAKGIVKRDVVRVITSGTYLDESSHDPRYILCLSFKAKAMGVAFTDPATGTIHANQYPSPQKAIELLARLPVYECIFPQGQDNTAKALFHHPLIKIKGITQSPQDDWSFNVDIARKSLNEHFGLTSLRGFGIEEMPEAISSAGALLQYLKQMNKQPLKHIDRIARYADEDYVCISPAATYGLELEKLFKTINLTLTSLGRRKLHEWLYHPLKNPLSILTRQAAVTLLREQKKIREHLQTCLQAIPDLEKCLSKLSCGYLQAKDLLAIRNGLVLLPQIRETIEPLAAQNSLFKLQDIPDLRKLLMNAIDENVPLAKPEGKTIRKGYHPPLDELRDIQENGRRWLQGYQEKESKRTRIHSLKVGYNKIFGYYIEISKANLHLAPSDYIRKQTLVNAERFITPELKEYEEKILTAQETILKIENELLRKLQGEILDHSADLHEYARCLGTLDSLYSLAQLSLRPGYIAPLIDDGTVIELSEGRHPVVEALLDAPFVPNDTLLDCEDTHLIILTGPNMAGKSTYIRQVAILVILAQIGSYIPARRGRIGAVDKIFTRIGAQDDITKGQSTFMVEMNEMADILHNLSHRSLVILDEIGRGTSTFDGLSLAWALAEYLQKQKARTLFATHFHEITALETELSGIKNFNIAVKEWKEEIIFLHKIIPGGTDDSYGIYVAKLAGIPAPVIDRSRKILTQLELKGHPGKRLKAAPSREAQIDFLNQNDPRDIDTVRSVIQALDINSITPLEALHIVHELKEKIQ